MFTDSELKKISQLIKTGVVKSSNFCLKVTKSTQSDDTAMSLIASQINEGILRGVEPKWELVKEDIK